MMKTNDWYKILLTGIAIFVYKVSFCQVSFLLWQNLPTTNRVILLAAGDLNNDSLTDVVVMTDNAPNSQLGNTLVVFYQNSTGNLVPTNPIRIPYVFLGPKAIDVADVNDDQLQDIIINNGDSIGIFYQNHAGTLNNMVSLYSGSNVNTITCGDLNNDGLTDIAVGFRSEFFIKVFYQNSSGFSSRNYPTVMAFENAIEIGDINYDGLNDMVFLPSQFYGGIRIYLQDSLGLLSNPIVVNSPAPYANSPMDDIAIGDLDNNGKNSIVVVGGGNSPNAAIISWKPDSLSLLQNPIVYKTYDVPVSVKIDDLDLDGNKEIVCLHSGWLKISVHSRDSLGGYGNYEKFDFPYLNAYNPDVLCLGDLNHDGRVDVAAAGGSYGLVVMYNNSGLNSGVNLIDYPDSTVFIYPNPASEYIIVEQPYYAGNVQLWIFDVLGNVVLFDNQIQQKSKILTSTFSKGLYLLKLKSERFSISRKLVIE